MAVYVDNAEIPFRNMTMSHLEADKLPELHHFAARLGLRRSWFQNKSVPHYDVSRAKRLQAIKMGAIAEDCYSFRDNKVRDERHERWRKIGKGK